MNPDLITSLATTHLMPTLGVLIGILILVLVGYINWFKDTKSRAVSWLNKNIFRDKSGNQTMGEGLFMTITSYLVAIGGVILIISLFFLSPLWGNS